MKKYIPVILILVLITACTPNHEAAGDASPSPSPGDAAPSEEAIEAAVAWAESLAGEYEFSTVGGYETCKSLNSCGKFTANAYGVISPMYESAYILWDHCEQHPGDYDAPRGSLLFFDRHQYSPYGHVALCTGEKNLVQAGYLSIRKGTIDTESKYSSYLGWAWPPALWDINNQLPNPGTDPTPNENPSHEPAPSEEAIENAVSWAQSLVREESFPYADGSGDCPSNNQCLTFTANAYGSTDIYYYSAYILSRISIPETTTPTGEASCFSTGIRQLRPGSRGAVYRGWGANPGGV